MRWDEFFVNKIKARAILRKFYGGIIIVTENGNTVTKTGRGNAKTKVAFLTILYGSKYGTWNLRTPIFLSSNLWSKITHYKYEKVKYLGSNPYFYIYYVMSLSTELILPRQHPLLFTLILK